jgi:hypothetical protein
MQLMPADVNQSSGMRKAPAFNRGRDALIGCANEDQYENRDAGGDEHAANGWEHG